MQEELKTKQSWGPFANTCKGGLMQVEIRREQIEDSPLSLADGPKIFWEPICRAK